MTNPLIDTQWLEDRLGEVQVVDASWFMPGDPRSGAADHAEAHIPGAIFFDIDALSDHDTDLPHMLPTGEAFAAAAGRLGLGRDRPTVVYDSLGLFSAARVWWTLRVMGFPNVYVLDGGLKAWRAEGRPLEGGAVRPSPASISAAFDPTLVRDRHQVAEVLDSGAAQVLDARPAARFRAEVPEPRAGLRSGHMPGATSLPFGVLVGEDGKLKPDADLDAAFQAAGVDLDRPIITTCGSGVTAAILALALARLGRDDVAIYDGSWTEWGGRQDTPVVTGP